MIDVLSVVVIDAFWSGLAALGFAMLFNVPRRTLLFCVIGGAMGHATRTLMMEQFGAGIELATLLGATVVGIWGKFLAYRMKIPSMIFAVSGAIPMVPGVFAYRAMIAILEIATVPSTDASTVLLQASVNAIKTGLILAAIAVGIVMPTLIIQRDKPVV